MTPHDEAVAAGPVRLTAEAVQIAARLSRATERGWEAHLALARSGLRPDIELEREDLVDILAGYDRPIEDFLEPTHRSLAAIFTVVRGIVGDVPHMYDTLDVIRAAGLGPEVCGYVRGMCGYRRTMGDT